MPVGDKIIRDVGIPDSIKKGSLETKLAYISEVIPEDGCFFRTRSNRGAFTIKRSAILDAGNKSRTYGFASLISPEQKEFIREYGKEDNRAGRRDDRQRTEVKIAWGELGRLATQGESSEVREKASGLKKAVLDNPSKLLQDERQLCQSLGMSMNSYPKYVVLHESNRVTAIWQATTTGVNDAVRWGLLAPPSSGYKRQAVQDWLASRAGDTEGMKQRLEKEGLIRDQERHRRELG